MRINPTFLVITISLFSVGGWGLWKIIEPNFDQNTTLSNNPLKSVPEATNLKQERLVNIIKTPSYDSSKGLKQVQQWLEQGHTSQAIQFINDSYDTFNSEELDLFKRLFLNEAFNLSDQGALRKAQRLLNKASSLFNEIEIFDLLTQVSIDLQDWQSALNAMLKSSLIESDPDNLITKLSTLSNIASQLKSQYAASSDYESIRKLYQSLYDAHPSYAYFQLELAFGYLALNDLSNAKLIFNAIQYDLEVGAQAQEQLAILNDLDQQERQAAINAREQLEAQKQQAAAGRNDIPVSLIRSGNSFLIDSLIEGKSARLLLDTGASITALSPALISRLRLNPTGGVIKISTANGITDSQLYLAERIKLGRFTVRDLIVAEVNLGGSGRFEGLLGTDLLNKVGDDYSYLIDNENNQLIFRRKRR